MNMYEKEKLDLTAFGQAVKKARENKNMSREQLAEVLDISARHTQYIETRGQHPSLQKFYEIVTLFNISADQFFFTNNTESKTTQRRQLDAMLDSMDEKELSIITATAKAMQELR
ncbi:MAG: helix-turn-helix transcriptional regulator [Oscillospiraceae bacterium]|nr:helix-turn-helix transcriptional regulator [Oscillospiraceae bacterium]